MNSNLDKCMKELKNFIDEECWTVLLAKNKYIVDGEKLSSLLDRIAKCYPVELNQAREVLAQRDELEQNARKECENMRQQAAKYSEETMLKARRNRERILAEAEAEAKAKIDDQEIIAAAQKQATAIVEKAKSDAVKMKKVTMDYLRNALDESSRSLGKANELVDSLRSLYNGDDDKE